VPDRAPEPPRRVVRISARTIVLAVAAVTLTILALRFVGAAHQPLSWAVAAAVVAVLIDPVVDVLDRRLPRILSVIIALVVAATATWLVIYVAFDDLSSGVDRLGESAQDAAEQLEDRDDRIGRVARDVDATRRVDLLVDALEERVTGTDDVIESTAGTAPTYFIGGVLTLFLMSYGPRLARAATDQVPDPERREEIVEIVTRALRRARRAVLLTVGEGLVVGLAVAAVATLLDIPSPAALGLVAGIMAMLPHLGLVLGTVPLVLLVLALRSDLATVVTVIVVLAAQVADSFWVRRRISARSVHIGLLVPWVVALVGYRVYGVGGVAYGLALAVFVLAILDEVGWRRRRAESAVDRPGRGGADDPCEPEEGGTTPATDDGDPATAGPATSPHAVPVD
jgi:predicted PurR-regulated permease PerM